MGGLLILTAALVPTLLWADLANPFIWIAVLSTAAFGAIGFVDDYLKVVRRDHHGLRPRYKMAAQTAVAIIVGLVLLSLSHQDPPLYTTRLIFPFFKNLIPDLGWGYVPFTVLVLVGASNAVNLTDGLDGLAISASPSSAATFTALTYVTGHAVFAELPDAGALPAGRRAHHLLRRAGRREPRLPVVELVPGGHLHGRRRVAGARRRRSAPSPS